MELGEELIDASNHMFERAILDKLPECIFENFEIPRVKRGNNIFKQRAITNQRAGNYKVTPLTVQCWFQWIM